MDRDKTTPIDQENTALNSSADAQSRRGFLGGFGAMGLAVMAGMMDASPTQALTLQDSIAAVPQLSSVGNINVIRDEKHDVPGGMEQIVQYVVSDNKGTNVRHSYQPLSY